MTSSPSTETSSKLHFLYLRGHVHSITDYGKTLIFENSNFSPTKNKEGKESENIADLSHSEGEEEEEREEKNEDKPPEKRAVKRTKLEKKAKKELKKICKKLKQGKLSGTLNSTVDESNLPLSPIDLRLRGSRVAEASEQFYNIRAGELNHHFSSPLFDFEFILVTRDKEYFDVVRILSFQTRLSKENCSLKNIKSSILKKSMYFGKDSASKFAGMINKNFGKDKKITNDTVLTQTHIFNMDVQIKRFFQNYFIQDGVFADFIKVLNYFNLEFNDFTELSKFFRDKLGCEINDKKGGLDNYIFNEDPEETDLEVFRSICEIIHPRDAFINSTILSDKIEYIVRAFQIFYDYELKFKKFGKQFHSENASDRWSDGIWKELKEMKKLETFILKDKESSKAIKFRDIDEKKKKLEGFLSTNDYTLLQSECDSDELFFKVIADSYSTNVKILTNSENRVRFFGFMNFGNIQTIDDFQKTWKNNQEERVILIDRTHLLEKSNLLDVLEKYFYNNGEEDETPKRKKVVFSGSLLFDKDENPLKTVSNHILTNSLQERLLVVSDKWSFPRDMIISRISEDFVGYFNNKKLTVYYSNNSMRDQWSSFFRNAFGSRLLDVTHFQLRANSNHEISMNSIVVLEKMSVNDFRFILNWCSPRGQFALFSDMDKEDFFNWYQGKNKKENK